jgi:membrane-bound ClpP family serine protease
MNFETVVIYSDDDIIDVIHGKNSELLRTLKKHQTWETMMEELDEHNKEPKNINELLLEHESSLINNPYSIRIKLFKNQNYKP